MKTQKKIENWCRDEKFMRYADKRMGMQLPSSRTASRRSPAAA